MLDEYHRKLLDSDPLVGVVSMSYRPSAAPYFRLFLAFVLIAIAARLAFWLYTGRIWEDALISLSPARNVWEGFGLTHHASEPRIYSFTSALGEMVLIAGEAVRQGLLAMRLVSLACAALAVFWAWRIGVLLGFPWFSHALLLGYLALDHLQVFFGMAGMETQIATALAIGSMYFLVVGNWTALGIVLGAGTICRPDFVFISSAVGMFMLFNDRRNLLRVVAVAVAVAAPWVIFSTLYYGSPFPQTIEAKQVQTNAGFWHAGTEQVLSQFFDTWRYLAPFRQYWAAPEAPLPDWMLKIVVAGILGLAVTGAVSALRQNRAMLVPLFAALMFLGFRTTFNVNPYFMWYMPPFLALLFLSAGMGVTAVSRRMPGIAAVLALVLVAPYASQLAFTMPLDRLVQDKIENGVRLRLGIALNQMMGADDAVVLEPIGYIGWAAFNKTVWDWPGLTSRIALEAHKRTRGLGMPYVIKELRPQFLVFRDIDVPDFLKDTPDTAKDYMMVQRFQLSEPLVLSHWGLHYWVTDQDMSIWRRR